MRKRTILLTDRELELIQVALFQTSLIETKEKLYSKLSVRLGKLWFKSLSKSELKKMKTRQKKKRIEEPEDELQALNTISVKTEDKYEKKEDE